MSKVILKGFIVVPKAELTAVINELDNHIRLTRLEDGCLIFEVTQNEENPYRFDVYEEFRDQAAFDKHQLRVKSSTWGKVSANVERNYEVTVSCA
ncbi:MULTISPECIES: putative quinol monooxygenase [unclassified Vibrio]|uniref:putative quinol monooxygenase n=1 Tax=unclassified Vibrio TaxID=2614977 RepID=UPI000B8E7B0A|nr:MULTISPECIES: putative quinol monooxygenase [unclassified Vibrio]NAW99258.1 antibiotic biosynthesis monooxygenase [Vibrio sp. V23_P3S9T160]OXX48523.1 antibiotic biosynthesis monooxygenase [Vibrio sp. V11_P1A41T118]